MRRKEKEIPKNELPEIIARQKVCRLGLCRDNMPYVVPLNFGYEMQGENLILYFHCAKEGLKLDIIEQNNQCFFEMDDCLELVTTEIPCEASAKYESVMGWGIIETLDDYAEKLRALERISTQYASYQNLTFSEKAVESVKVLKLSVRQYSGKRALK